MFINDSSNLSMGFTKDGCFKNFTVIGCSRDAVEVLLGLVTLIFCLIKIIKLHLARYDLWNQYLIFYAAITEICLLSLDWMYLHQPIVVLVAELLKLIQFLVVCRYYCEIASRMSKRENIYKWFFMPSLIILMVYFFCLMIIGFFEMKDNKYACAEPEWLLLSCSEVFLGIVFIVIGSYITKQINSLKTDPYFRKNLKTSLWGIILSFEVSSLVSMSFDLTMIVVGKKNKCKGVILDDTALYTAIDILIKIGKWLLPIWAMMIVFKPDSFQGNKMNIKESDIEEQPPIIQRAIAGFKSEFRPRVKSFNYKHLQNPDTEEEKRIVEAQKQDGLYVQVKKKKKKRKTSRNTSEGSSNTSISPSNPSLNSERQA